MQDIIKIKPRVQDIIKIKPRFNFSNYTPQEIHDFTS